MLRQYLAILILSAAAFGVGCASESDSAAQPSALENESAAVSQGTFQTQDNLTIAYDMRGQGETTLLFVHCWACDRTYWREQLDVFADGYRVVSLDLAGHGDSGKQRAEWTLQGLAGDVEALVHELGLERVILVGHSMGGPVSLLAAARLPEKVIGVVGVDNLHNAEFTFPPEMAEQIVGGFEADFGGSMGQMVPAMFPQGADPALIEWIVEKASAAEQTPVISLMRDFTHFSYKEAFSALRVPVRCINALPWQPGGMETAVAINQKYADYDAVMMQGVGHYLHLERPDEFNSHLRDVLAAIESR